MILKLCSKLLAMVNNIHHSIITLPKPIRRVCAVQVFAFMGWCGLFALPLMLSLKNPANTGSRFCSTREILYLLAPIILY
jgi:hypothetical protein